MDFDINAAKLYKAEHLPWSAGYAFPPHTHPYWEFVYFIGGRGYVRLPNVSFRPQQYFLMVYPAGTVHAETTDPDNPEDVIGIDVFIPGSPPTGAPLMLPDHHGELRWLCERIVVEYEAFGHSPLTEAYVSAFLLLIKRAWENQPPARLDAVDCAIQHLHENYVRPITLVELSECASLSAPHFVRRFTARVGTSPMRYLQQIRIENSKRMLLTTSLPINEIALKCGFENAFYFARVFRKATGSAPTSFRAAKFERDLLEEAQTVS